MRIVVVGCGVIGALIAYELSQVPGLTITVLDYQPPAQASTGAALGVLMGIISQKIKGKAWEMRQTSIRRYDQLIPELEELTGQGLAVNRHGILKLCFEDDDLERWQSLIDLRHKQGWRLELWERDQIVRRCPQIRNSFITAAIYSPQDRQLDPTALTLALVNAAQQRGVEFQLNTRVEPLPTPCTAEFPQQATLQTSKGSICADWVVLAAGLGSTALTQLAPQPLSIRPVLGQALHLAVDQPLGDPQFQPMITGQDIHIVPIGDRQYWIGATVEFPGDAGEVTADSAQLEAVMAGAIALCPALAQGTILRSWSGLRPRPDDRPAPIVEPLPGYPRVLVATGHYRNGVLLAPATALLVKEAILGKAVNSVA